MNNDFGIHLRELRTARDMTQRELAKEVGVNFTYLCKIERGVAPPPSAKKIIRLAKVLRADPDLLLLRGGKMLEDVRQIFIDYPELLPMIRDAARRCSIAISDDDK